MSRLTHKNTLSLFVHSEKQCNNSLLCVTFFFGNDWFYKHHVLLSVSVSVRYAFGIPTIKNGVEPTSSSKTGYRYPFFFVTQGVNLGQPDDCPDHVYQVMRNCWHKDVSQRPTFPLIIAQLKQEAVSYDDPFNNVPESPVHDKQPLYLSVGASHEVLGSKCRKCMAQ